MNIQTNELFGDHLNEQNKEECVNWDMTDKKD